MHILLILLEVGFLCFHVTVLTLFFYWVCLKCLEDKRDKSLQTIFIIWLNR